MTLSYLFGNVFTMTFLGFIFPCDVLLTITFYNPILVYYPLLVFVHIYASKWTSLFKNDQGYVKNTR